MDYLLTEPSLFADSEAHDQAELNVECFSGPAVLDRLEPVWNDLNQRAGLEHPFATHAWISSWWEAFGGDAELRVLAALRGTAVDGLAVLMRRPGARRWQSLHNAHTPRVDWPVDRLRRAETFAALWQALTPFVRHGGLDFGDVPDASPMLAALTSLARRDGVRVGLQPSVMSPAVDTTEAWESYAARLGARHRRNMRVRLAKLARYGEVTLEVVRGGPELRSALAHGLSLEAAAWKRDAGTAIATGDDRRIFYTTLAERAAARGWLRLIFLTSGGRRVAFAFALHYGPRLFLLKIGYDPELARLSPGHLLFWCLLRHACGTACLREVDLLGTFDDWKRRWTREARPHSRLALFGGSLRDRLEHALRYRAMPLVRDTPLHEAWHAARRSRLTRSGSRHAD